LVTKQASEERGGIMETIKRLEETLYRHVERDEQAERNDNSVGSKTMKKGKVCRRLSWNAYESLRESLPFRFTKFSS
jgi:hypothetical protein